MVCPRVYPFASQSKHRASLDFQKRPVSSYQQAPLPREAFRQDPNRRFETSLFLAHPCMTPLVCACSAALSVGCFAVSWADGFGGRGLCMISRGVFPAPVSVTANLLSSSHQQSHLANADSSLQSTSNKLRPEELAHQTLELLCLLRRACSPPCRLSGRQAGAVLAYCVPSSLKVFTF